MILSDEAIKSLCEENGFIYKLPVKKDGKEVGVCEVPISNLGRPLIRPFVPESVSTDVHGRKVPSYGLSSHGYDIRLAPEFKMFSRANDGTVIDVLDFKEEDIINTVYAESVVLPPGGLLLSRTVETFNIPRNVIGICQNKSTHARVGTFSLVTPLEPGWSGQLVVEITNTTNLPMRIHSGIGIAQIQFYLGMDCNVSYSDRNGKYQNQTGITTSKL